LGIVAVKGRIKLIEKQIELGRETASRIRELLRDAIKRRGR
jgi:hypothetical protein